MRTSSSASRRRCRSSSFELGETRDEPCVPLLGRAEISLGLSEAAGSLAGLAGGGGRLALGLGECLASGDELALGVRRPGRDAVAALGQTGQLGLHGRGPGAQLVGPRPSSTRRSILLATSASRCSSSRR